MILPDDEYERRLAMFRTRVDNYSDVDPAYGARWGEWCRTLLATGGTLVVPPLGPDPDLDTLLAGAAPAGPAVREVPGEIGECHENVATRWIDGEIDSIGTGYALSEDAMWRQHSWGLDPDGTVVETTDERRAYVGVVLPARVPSLRFAGSNAPVHLKTVLRERDPLVLELIDIMRELVAAGRRP